MSGALWAGMLLTGVGALAWIRGRTAAGLFVAVGVVLLVVGLATP